MWFDQAAAWILHLQRGVYSALGDRIREAGESPAGFAGALAFALALGAVHALTPGHGKAVVFSYFVGTRGRAWGGVLMGTKIAVTHVATALLLVAIFGSAASMFGRPSGVAQGVQVASYALILVIGLWLVYRAARELRAPDRRTGPHRHDLSRGWLPFAVGLLPCPMTMLIMTFAAANASIGAGLILVVFLGIGIAVTIAAVGSLGILFRHGLFARLDPAGRRYAAALGVLQLASAILIAGLGGVFLLGALDRVRP